MTIKLKFCQDSETKPAAGGDLKSFQGINMYRMQNSKEKKMLTDTSVSN